MPKSPPRTILPLLAALLSGACGDASSATPDGEQCPDSPAEYSDVFKPLLFLDADHCVDEACATPETAAMYTAWKARVLAVTGWTEAEFDAHVLIRDIEQANDAVAIHVILLLGDLRVAAGDVLLFDGTHDPPTAEDIAFTLEHNFTTTAWQAAVDTSPCAADIAVAFTDCGKDMRIDWERAHFWGPDNSFDVYATAEQGEDCVFARVDLRTAKVLECTHEPCGVDL
jgi:hypothetical protein